MVVKYLFRAPNKKIFNKEVIKIYCISIFGDFIASIIELIHP